MNEQTPSGQNYPQKGILDVLTRVDDLLILNAELLKMLLERAGGGQASQVGYNISVSNQLMKVEIIKIFDNHGCREASTTFYPIDLVNCRDAENVLIIAQSSLNESVNVQAIGGLSAQVDGTNAFNIESSQSLSAGLLGMGVDLTTNWYPYMGCAVTTSASAPASGSFNAWLYIRKRIRG